MFVTAQIDHLHIPHCSSMYKKDAYVTMVCTVIPALWRCRIKSGLYRLIRLLIIEVMKNRPQNIYSLPPIHPTVHYFYTGSYK